MHTPWSAHISVAQGTEQQASNLRLSICVTTTPYSSRERASRFERESWWFESTWGVFELKVCANCRQEKSATEFGLKNVRTGALQSYCKDCQRAKSREHYEANKTAYFERNAHYRETLKQFVRDLKEGRPCADCGIEYPPPAMDWHHLDASLKSFNVSNPGRWTKRSILAEIEKCVLLCANCHRLRHHGA